MKLEDIPRRQERLVVADATFRILSLMINRFFEVDRLSAFLDVLHVLGVVWVNTLNGREITVQKISYGSGMPRPTVLRKLEYLIGKGYVVRHGHKYVITDETLRECSSCLDKSINIFFETADVLSGAKVSKTDTLVMRL